MWFSSNVKPEITNKSSNKLPMFDYEQVIEKILVLLERLLDTQN